MVQVLPRPDDCQTRRKGTVFWRMYGGDCARTGAVKGDGTRSVARTAPNRGRARYRPEREPELAHAVGNIPVSSLLRIRILTPPPCRASMRPESKSAISGWSLSSLLHSRSARRAPVHSTNDHRPSIKTPTGSGSCGSGLPGLTAFSQSRQKSVGFTPARRYRKRWQQGAAGWKQGKLKS